MYALKKFIVAFLITALGICALIGVQASEPDFLFRVSDAEIGYLQEGKLTVSVANNRGFASYILEITYDAELLELTDCTRSVGSDAVYDNGSLVINDETPGFVRIVFAAQENVTADIPLVDLTFRATALPIDGEPTPVGLVVTFLDDEVWNDDALTASASAEGGSVKVSDGIRVEELRLERSGEAVSYTVRLSAGEPSEALSLWVAEYAEDGRFLGLQCPEIAFGSELRGELLYGETATVRCFLLGESFVPMAESKEASVN